MYRFLLICIKNHMLGAIYIIYIILLISLIIILIYFNIKQNVILYNIILAIKSFNNQWDMLLHV